jgi:hypothetical protein
MEKCMTVVDVDNLATDALAIVEKYEAFVRYLYPILQRSPRQHGVFRDVVLAMLFSPVGGLYHAARSRQVSRLYAVDAEFATLRSHLRFSASTQMKIITPHQHKTALALLSEPGRMLGAWQKKLLRGRQAAGSESPSAQARSEGQAGK